MTLDISIGALRVSVLGYQYPEARDYWDGNWLMVRTRLETSGCILEVNGPFLRCDDFERFLAGVNALEAMSAEQAELASMESYFWLGLKRVGSLGALAAEVHMTPDPLCHKHEVCFGLDMSWLPGIARQVRQVLKAYPLRGESDV